MRNMELRRGAAPAAFSLALAIALGGCASSGEKSTAAGMWDRAVQGVSSAYDATKTAVTATIQRITKDQGEGWDETQKKEAAPAAPAVPAPETRPPDRYPAAGQSAPREQDLGRPAQQAQAPATRRITLLPRIPQTPDQIRARMTEIDGVLTGEKDPAARQRLAAERGRLAGALQASLEEESLIREMEQLRARLRRLQDRLNEIQRARQ